ncbi:uncharacterized protein LOC144661209 [Oculina patagonica]
MAEATDPFENPFDVEMVLLLREEAETAEKRLKAILAKDVKVEQEDATRPLVAKPVWPYVMWCVNYVNSPSEFNRKTRHRVPLSCTRESNQPDQMSNRDHSSSIDTTIDSCESKLVCEANLGNESMPNPEAIEYKSTDEPLSMDDMTDLLQRSINMLSDLQDLLSIGVEKYLIRDTGKNETDSMISEDKQTQRTLEGGETMQEMAPRTMNENENSRLEEAVEENLQLPYTDDKSTSVGYDVSLTESSEKLKPISQNKVYSKENIKTETNDVNLKCILKSEECEEVLRTRADETGPSCESDHAIPSLCDAFDYQEDATDIGGRRSLETMETKSNEKSTGIEESGQDMRVTSVDTPKQVSTFKVHHFKTELQSPVSEQSVLYNTITKWLPSISIDPLIKTERIKQLVKSLMNNTVQEL